MFKLRRPSVCSDVDIVSDSSSASDVSDEIYKGVSINSISESRPTLLVEGSSGKWKGSEYCDKKSSSKEVVDLGERNGRESSSDICVADGGMTESGKQKTGTRQSSNCSSDINCSSPTAAAGATTTTNLNSSSSSSSSSSSASSPVGIMCDRKRKERHESCSQGQEKKVIRSLSSHEDPKIEVEAENNTTSTTTTTTTGTTTETNFRRSHSNDNFESKGGGGGASAGESVDDVELLEQEQLPKLESNGNEQQQRVTGQTNGREATKQQQQTGNHINNSSGPLDSTLYGLGSLSNPQYGIVKNMPTDFEAELQRKWERSAQWSSSSSSRKVHSGRKHRSRSSKSSSSSSTTAVAVIPEAAPTVPRKSIEELAVDDGQDFDELSGIIGVSFNEDELHSPTSEDSSTSSIESLEDMENQEKLLSPNVSCEELEADLAEDLSLEQCELADASQSQKHQQQEEPRSLGNENNLEPVPHLDFSTLLHHQVETNEPIPFLAALQASGAEDQVMLSPRNSVLIKEACDPSIPPSPPLHQAMLDPPLSRQHGGNQNMKMNLLSKQVSNLKRHLKSLEEEYEQLFGYRPSHADKLNQKEMRKCLLQLTKAKRELKEMREDPANLNCGGLLQVDQSCTNYPRNSPEALRSLDATVKEIYKTMNDKRRVQCRPVDPNLMTQSELNEEKNVMQKQLLMLEKRHGRPGSKEEKEIVRTLYDRYRCLKKTGSRLGNIKENSIDLAPILEHETLELSSSSNNEVETNTTSVVEVIKKDTGSRKGRRRIPNATDDEDEDGILNFRNEGFTEMSLSELESRQSLAKDEKRRLRSVLRKFEADFQNATGRPPLKDEKYSSAEMENIYQKYKRCRATVRLLDVLITKRKYPQLLVDMNKIED